MNYRQDHVARLTCLFNKAIKHRDRLLTEATLRKYIQSFLARKDIFKESGHRFGTPQYIFDQPALSLAITRFKDTFSEYLPRYQVFYAMKSNSFSGLCQQAVAQGLGLDVSSGLELLKALETGCKRIIFSGPGKTIEELKLAIKYRERVTLQVDSFGELGRVSKLIAKSSKNTTPLRMGIRIHSQNSWSKFGTPLKDLPLILRQAMGIKGLDPCGLQFHASWNLDPSAQIEMINTIGDFLSKSVPADSRSRLRFLDIGGGFWPEIGEWLNSRNTIKGRILEIIDPQVRFQNKHYHLAASPLEKFALGISKELLRQPSPLKEIEVWMEPGRWISNSAMHILLTVLDKKDHYTVITDGGINLLGWERPLSEYIPLLNLTRPSLKEIQINVYGSLCTPLDVWGYSIFGEGIEEGDVLLVPDQGAYTYSLRQSFIKPIARVVQFNGSRLRLAEKEENL